MAVFLWYSQMSIQVITALSRRPWGMSKVNIFSINWWGAFLNQWSKHSNMKPHSSNRSAGSFETFTWSAVPVASFLSLLKTPLKACLVSTNGVLGGISSYEYVKLFKWKVNDQVFIHWCSQVSSLLLPLWWIKSDLFLLLLKDSVVLWPQKLLTCSV